MNMLPDHPNDEVTKSCLNHAKEPQNQINSKNNTSSLTKAVLAISKLPLTNEEKAEMIRLLMK